MRFQEYSGIRLYWRSKDDRIHLTKAGVAFVNMAPNLFSVRDDLLAALIAFHKGEIPSLRFGCGTFVDPGLFDATSAIHKRYLPGCAIHPSHADSAQLAADVIAGKIDASLITLPAEASELQVEEIRRDRLVLCLRADDPLALKATLRAADLADRLRVINEPQRYPAAHDRLQELLEEAVFRLAIPPRLPISSRCN